MSLPIIDTLRPLGNFPAVDASDVQAGNERLSTRLSNTPTTTYVDSVVENKVDKVEGKGLSTNDFTNTYKSKLDGLDNALAAKANSSDVTSGLAGKVDKVTGKGLSTNDYTTAEKNKLAGIEAQANKTVVDSALSSSSTNPVQNKVINTALGAKADASTVATLAETVSGKADSSTVSTLSSQVSTNTTNIATQTARIDSIASLPSGSTSGDAELMDIRVKADGTTAGSAGSAVREQVENLNNYADTLSYASSSFAYNGYAESYMDDTGEIKPLSNCYTKKSDKVKVNAGDRFLYRGKGSESNPSVLWINSQGAVFDTYSVNSTFAFVTITVPANAVYAIFSSYDRTTTADNVIFNVVKIGTNILGNSNINILELSDGDDLNIITRSGMYIAYSNLTFAHFPPVNAEYNTTGVLKVYYNGLVCVQEFVQQNSGGSHFIRSKSNSGNWSEWRSNDSTYRNLTAYNITDLNNAELGVNYFMSNDQVSKPSNFPDTKTNDKVGILETYDMRIDASTKMRYQRYTDWYTGDVYYRLATGTAPNLTWRNWNRNDKKEISILFVGNSLTQDGIAYLPYVLRTFFPEIKFKFYMWYNGGKTLANQYDYFVNGTPCDIFSVAENVKAWTNYNSSKTMDEILSTYTFDIVCMQEYFNYKETYPNVDDWENCKNYIQSHYTANALEFISLFHAPKRDNTASIYAMTLFGNKKILAETISQDMIPMGIAVYDALSTDLDSLGDQGHLSPDGTHTQEGLPCLLQTYVALLWLFDKMGVNKSIYGSPMRMTTAIYNTLNVPGANLGSGVITGTDAQNLLAQEVAIKAYKKGKGIVQKTFIDLQA